MSQAALPTPPRRTRPRLRDILADRTLALMLALGFSSGLPFLLVLGTQAARLAEAKVPVEAIGLISWVGLCYSLKFLWAPAIDTLDEPWLARRLGRRRAWLLVSQIGVAAGLVSLAFADPARSLTDLIIRAALTGFAAATQDIVIDGWRIDSAPPNRQGMMAATGNFGYRLALLCAGAGALYLADFASWRTAYLAMAALMSVGIVAGLLSPRLPERARDPAATFATRLTEPVTDLWRRFGPLLAAILLLVALYRLPDFLSGVMANPLYIGLGFSKSDIATMSKVYGIWIGVAGAFAGGLAITRIGLMPALLIGGVAAAASHLCLALLAANGKSLVLLALSVSAESFAGNFAGAALIAYMSSLTAPALAASQYALLSSLYALLGKFLGGFSGYAVKEIGFARFFAATATIGVPVAALCLLVWAKQRAAADAGAPLVARETLMDRPDAAAIHVTRWGAAGARVVLVHGGVQGSANGGAQAFANQRSLADRWRLVVPDRPGHGLSPDPGRPDDADADGAWVADLLGSGAHLVGHSFGGCVALAAAARRPEAVHSLTLIEPAMHKLAPRDPQVRMFFFRMLCATVFTLSPVTRAKRVMRVLGIPPDVRRGASDADLRRMARAMGRAKLPARDVLERQLAAGRDAGTPLLVVSGGWSAAFDATAEHVALAGGGRHTLVPAPHHFPQAVGDGFNRQLAAFMTASERRET